MATQRFHLQKWYLDCVTPTGELLIGYVATLRWGAFRAAYAATVELDAQGVRQRQLHRAGQVTRTGEHLVLDVPGLKLLGLWTGTHGSGPQVLHAADDGRITWDVLALPARVDVRSGDRRLQGAGYAEVLTLSVPPWRLPFADLGWGRFVADDAATGFTWVEWRDASGTLLLERTWGASAPVRHGMRLAATRPIRQGLVSDSLLGRLAPLKRLLPRGLREVTEQKYLSRGTLTDGTTGWVVHEEVLWR